MQPNPRFTHPVSIAGAAIVAVALFVAIVLMIPATSAAKPAARASVTPGTSARVNACVSAPTYANRKIDFSGRMFSLPSANGGKMQMRVDVFRKYDESRRYRLLAADGLGQWLSNSEPTATVYVRNVSLAKVETGARYKARVHYRWLDADGKTLAKKTRMTKVCKQTAMLPDPAILGIKKFPNPGQLTTTYDVSVYNTSKSEALNVPVSLAIDGKPPVTQIIESIEGKALVVVSFADMDSCKVEKFARIDPFNVIRERNEKNNNARDSAC